MKLRVQRNTIESLRGASYKRTTRGRKLALIREERRDAKLRAKNKLAMEAMEAWHEQVKELALKAPYSEPKEPGILGITANAMFIFLFMYCALNAMIGIGNTGGVWDISTLILGTAVLFLYIGGKVSYFFWTLPKWRKAKKIFSEQHPVFANIIWPIAR